LNKINPAKKVSFSVLKSGLLPGVSLLLSACTGVPDNVTVVTPFELNKYLGQWHEIARLDHSFERGLTQVSAHYSLNADGSVKVLNRGFSAESQEWDEAEGVAKFVGPSDQGRLKVSFFGPFYGAYNIAKLTPDYSMALVVGPDLTYAWLLARSEIPEEKQCAAFYQAAAELGIKPQDWIKIRSCK
jgi:apolipoprotein D and lipocalin family protein